MALFGNGCGGDNWVWLLIIIILISSCGDGIFGNNNGCCDNGNNCCDNNNSCC